MHRMMPLFYSIIYMMNATMGSTKESDFDKGLVTSLLSPHMAAGAPLAAAAASGARNAAAARTRINDSATNSAAASSAENPAAGSSCLRLWTDCLSLLSYGPLSTNDANHTFVVSESHTT